MVSVDKSEIEGGLELADAAHLNGLEIPVYNFAEVVPVASELYPVVSADQKIDTPPSPSTSRINLETESEKSQLSPLQKSFLIRRKHRLSIFTGAILLSVISITIGILVARALQGKSGIGTSDSSASPPKVYGTSEIQTAIPTSPNTVYPQSTTTMVSLSISVETSVSITTPSAPTTLQTSASLSSPESITTSTSRNTFTSLVSSTLATNSCQNPPIIKCSEPSCEGINDQLQVGGLCTAGVYNGCPCVSVCGDVPGPCSLNKCYGVNNTFLDGICWGCKCA